MTHVYRTLRIAPTEEGVLAVAINAPPMNLIGPDLVRDLVTLLGALESDPVTRVVVLESADPEYFIPHVYVPLDAGQRSVVVSRLEDDELVAVHGVDEPVLLVDAP